MLKNGSNEEYKMHWNFLNKKYSVRPKFYKFPICEFYYSFSLYTIITIVHCVIFVTALCSVFVAICFKSVKFVCQVSIKDVVSSIWFALMSQKEMTAAVAQCYITAISNFSSKLLCLIINLQDKLVSVYIILFYMHQ